MRTKEKVTKRYEDAAKAYRDLALSGIFDKHGVKGITKGELDNIEIVRLDDACKGLVNIGTVTVRQIIHDRTIPLIKGENN